MWGDSIHSAVLNGVKPKVIPFINIVFATSLAIFRCYFQGYCSELAEFMPPPAFLMTWEGDT